MTLKIWLNETSQPEYRYDVPYSLAYALATRGGYAKAQVINPETDTIELESK